MYSEKLWNLENFERSTGGVKKVVAILKNKVTGKKVEVKFGQRGSTTYRDLTGVGGDKIHNDLKKRENYRKRHKGEGSENRKYSPGWFSYHFLW